MSIESAKAYLDKMKTDEDFAAQVMKYTNRTERMAFVLSNRFDFTPEELEKASTLIPDDELDLVVGGYHQNNPNGANCTTNDHYFCCVNHLAIH